MVKALILPFSVPYLKAQSLLGFAFYRLEAVNRGGSWDAKLRSRISVFAMRAQKNLRSLGCKSVQVQAAAGLFGDFNHYPAI